jgi:hypothetical protein
MIEIAAIKNYNYKEICEVIDFISQLIEGSKWVMKRKKFSKVYREFFLFFNRIPSREKIDIKNKLTKYFLSI